MRIVLVAYDFPPVPSPQSLRWAYLVGELDRMGHEVCVLAPDVPGYGPGGLPGVPQGVKVHRVSPGWLPRLLTGRGSCAASVPPSRGRFAAAPDGNDRTSGSGVQDAVVGRAAVVSGWVAQQAVLLVGGKAMPTHLNWKGQAAEVLKALVSRVRFPDYRAAWVPHARKALWEIAAVAPPDIVVTSHEPACSLQVGLAAAKMGLRWAVDLGDPVLAVYTPRHWRRRAERLEREVVRSADFVSVTTQATADLLSERHQVPAERFLVISQGFDATFSAKGKPSPVEFNGDVLELLYTGSFYSFRRAEGLIQAIEATRGVRLTIATLDAPDYLLEATERHPEKFRLTGYLPHVSALAAQRSCDVLVNIANDDPVQVPGKVYEYLGAGRPVLHVRGERPDAISGLLEEVGIGLDSASHPDAIGRQLCYLLERKQHGELMAEVTSAPRVAEYSWHSLAKKWERRVLQSVSRPGPLVSGLQES